MDTTSVSLVVDIEADSHLTFHQCATLMNPNKGETAVCGSSIFVMMTGEAITGCQLNRASIPQPRLHYTSVAGWYGCNTQ